jgi:putative endonuclease
MRFISGWPEHYGVLKLVYFQVTENVMSAIEREKELKGWVRRKKVALINSVNPEWKDLSEEWESPHPSDTLPLHFVQGQGDNQISIN